MKEFRDWSVIKKLDNDFVNHLNFAHVFNSGKSAIIITNNDCVYVCGDNNDGCLGLGYTDSVPVPTKLEQLCHKQVINIIDYDGLMYALTTNGVLYYWGYSNLRILGFNNDKNCVTPTIIESLSGKFIVDIKCGYGVWLALTINGEVYQWGSSEYCFETICYPKLVFGLKLHTIIAIACGLDHVLALNDNGEVFGWGCNECGELGCGRDEDEHIEPIKVEGLGDNKAIKISCGQNHSLVLTESRILYGFGNNCFGQLGDNGKDVKWIATKIIISTKFTDIATLGYMSNMSIGLSNDGYCYVWGEVNEDTITNPTKTQFKSIEEVLQNHNKERVTYKSLYFKKMFNNLSVYEKLENSFNNQEFKDITFKVDGNYIYAQKSHLQSVCTHFNAMFADNVWLESNAKEIEIKEYSYLVYYSFLKYLYTDSLHIQSKHLIELYYLADSYIEENLKRKCIDMMKMSTNVNNVYTFYSFAVQNNFDELEKYFHDYMLTYMTDVIKTEAYLQTNDSSILKKFIDKSAINGNLAINKKLKSTQN